MMGPKVIHDRQAHRFLMKFDDNSEGYLEYNTEGENCYVLQYIEIPEKFRAQGLADQLTKAAFDELSASGCQISVKDQYIQKHFLDLHPEYKKVCRD
eukprot:ANDGO_06346.mRNA.1 hypothetical protein Gasu_01780